MEKSLRAKKAELTREIHAHGEYVNDIKHELDTQHPQPNGNIFLHGEIITKHTLQTEQYILDRLIVTRQALDNK